MLERVRQKYEPRGVGFLALSLEPRASRVRPAAERLGIQMPVALARSEMLGPLGVSAVPSTVFIDASGFLVAAATGERSQAFFEERAEALLSGPAPAR